MADRIMDKAGKKRFAARRLIIIPLFLLGIALGIGMFFLRDAVWQGSAPELSALLQFGLFIPALLASIALHECGHLLFGLLSGWRFTFITLFGHMLIKKRGKIGYYRYRVPGASGTCAMSPPQPRNGRRPCALFLLGGGLMNALCLLLALPFVLSPHAGIALWTLLVYFALFNLIAVFNIIPFKPNPVLLSDGARYVLIRKNETERLKYFATAALNAFAADDVPLADYPEEYIAHVPVLQAARDINAAEGKSAQEQRAVFDFWLANDALNEGDKLLLTIDKISFELIAGDPDAARPLATPAVRQYIRRARATIGICASGYVLALLLDGDEKQAASLERTFNGLVRRFPFPLQVQNCRKLMQKAYNKHQNRNTEE